MPRQARETGEFLHIIVRGNGKQILFEDDSDKEIFLSFIRKFADETEHLEAEPRKKDDAWVLETIQRELNLINGTQLQQFENKQRDEMLASLKKKGLSVCQIERLTGINRCIIQKA